MTCSYSVGTILALLEKYKLTTPEIAIAGSGGAGTLAYYVSGQYDSIRNIWANLLSTKKFLNLARFWKVIDIDYLIDEVFKKQDPLLTKQVYNSHIKFLISCTNTQTGKVEYFFNKAKEDIFEVLRATKAMPFVYGKAVKINSSTYCDTSLSSCVNLNIEKAKSLGAERVLVLDNCFPDPAVENGMNLWINLRNKNFKMNYYTEFKRVNNILFDSSVFYLKPKRKLKISALGNDSDLLKEIIKLGYNDTLNNKELENFLG